MMSYNEETAPFLPGVEVKNSKTDAACESLPIPRKQSLIVVISACTGAMVTCLVWLIISTQILARHADQATVSKVATKNCGDDYKSAIAQGCKFQLWSYSWVPSECFDQELNDEYLKLQAQENWHYYVTEPIAQRTSPPIEVALESVLQGNRNDLWSTWGQHFWHCAFYQRKFFRVVEQHSDQKLSMLRMTNRDLSQEHALHCQKWLSHPQLYPWDEVRINLTVGYNSCS